MNLFPCQAQQIAANGIGTDLGAESSSAANTRASFGFEHCHALSIPAGRDDCRRLII
jgi:hypothetical protein